MRTAENLNPHVKTYSPIRLYRIRCTMKKNFVKINIFFNLLYICNSF